MERAQRQHRRRAGAGPPPPPPPVVGTELQRRARGWLAQAFAHKTEQGLISEPPAVEQVGVTGRPWWQPEAGRREMVRSEREISQAGVTRCGQGGSRAVAGERESRCPGEGGFVKRSPERLYPRDRRALDWERPPGGHCHSPSGRNSERLGGRREGGLQWNGSLST